MQPNDPKNDPGARPPGEGPPSRGAAGPRPGQLPAILNAAPTAATLLRCLRRRLPLAAALGVVLGGLAAMGAWFFAPPPKHVVRTLIRVPPNMNVIVRTGEAVPELPNHQ